VITPHQKSIKNCEGHNNQIPKDKNKNKIINFKGRYVGKKNSS
jgi:hypothetical protein